MKTIEIKGRNFRGAAHTRIACRGLVLRDVKLLLSHEQNTGWYLIPGGGLEPGESHEAALCREVREESGFTVVPGSVREYGLVRRITKGDKSDIFLQDNFYYLCDVGEAVGQHLDDYEAEERFTPEFVTPQTAIETNRFHDHNGKWGIVQERDSAVLESLMTEGYFN